MRVKADQLLLYKTQKKASLTKSENYQEESKELPRRLCQFKH